MQRVLRRLGIAHDLRTETAAIGWKGQPATAAGAAVRYAVHGSSGHVVGRWVGGSSTREEDVRTNRAPTLIAPRTDPTVHCTERPPPSWCENTEPVYKWRGRRVACTHTHNHHEDPQQRSPPFQPSPRHTQVPHGIHTIRRPRETHPHRRRSTMDYHQTRCHVPTARC